MRMSKFSRKAWIDFSALRSLILCNSEVILSHDLPLIFFSGRLLLWNVGSLKFSYPIIMLFSPLDCLTFCYFVILLLIFTLQFGDMWFLRHSLCSAFFHHIPHRNLYTSFTAHAYLLSYNLEVITNLPENTTGVWRIKPAQATRFEANISSSE